MARASVAARPAAARSAVSAELTPRERLLRLGAAALSDAELVSVLLQDTSSETAALDQAIDLLREVGGFPGFLHIDAGTLRCLGLSRRLAAAEAEAAKRVGVDAEEARKAADLAQEFDGLAEGRGLGRTVLEEQRDELRVGEGGGAEAQQALAGSELRHHGGARGREPRDEERSRHGLPLAGEEVQGFGEADLLDREAFLALGGEGLQGGDGVGEEIGADHLQDAAEGTGQSLGGMGLDCPGDQGNAVVDLGEVDGDLVDGLLGLGEGEVRIGEARHGGVLSVSGQARAGVSALARAVLFWIEPVRARLWVAVTVCRSHLLPGLGFRLSCAHCR